MLRIHMFIDVYNNGVLQRKTRNIKIVLNDDNNT